MKTQLEIKELCEKAGITKEQFDQVFDAIYETPSVDRNEDGEIIVLDCFDQGYVVYLSSDNELSYISCGG